MKKLWKQLKYDIKYSGYLRGYGATGEENIPGLDLIKVVVVITFIVFFIIFIVKSI